MKLRVYRPVVFLAYTQNRTEQWDNGNTGYEYIHTRIESSRHTQKNNWCSCGGGGGENASCKSMPMTTVTMGIDRHMHIHKNNRSWVRGTRIVQRGWRKNKDDECNERSRAELARRMPAVLMKWMEWNRIRYMMGGKDVSVVCCCPNINK